MKPDAYMVLESGTVVDHWWLEQDMATESLPTLRKKLTAYLDFVRRGQLGPNGVMPRVLVSVPSDARREAIAALIAHMPEPASQLVVNVTHEKAASVICEVLRE